MKESLFTLLLLLLLVVNAKGQAKYTFVITDDNFILGIKPIQICSSEMYDTQISKPYWHHLVKMTKTLELNAVKTLDNLIIRGFVP